MYWVIALINMIISNFFERSALLISKEAIYRSIYVIS
jgi:hypothetical protein